jgi:hypothetical protein
LKKFISIFIIGFLILGGIISYSTSINFNDNFDDITLRDDAFHGTTPYPSMEWWYFDGIFSNDYSIHIGFRILSFNFFQMLKPSINIYYKYDLIVNETTLIPKYNFFVSEEKPLLQIGNNTIMYVNQSNENNENYWTYHVDYNLNDVGVELIFDGTTKGWKYETLHEGWTVALPQSKVNGKISIGNEIIHVNGTGYHDHNWNFGIKTPARGWSWYWGKIRSENLCFSWANIKKTGILEQTFLEKIGVLNTINGSYNVIGVENISITPSKFIIDNYRLIPTEFHIYAEQNDILIDVNMETISIHRTDPTMLTIHYWRYFVKISGIIKKGNIVDELIDVPHIIEYMRFV